MKTRSLFFIIFLVFTLMLSACGFTDSTPGTTLQLTLPTPAQTDTALPTLEPTAIPTLPSPEPTRKITYFPSQAYVPDGRKEQKLDIYLPETGDGPFPTILAFHGGAFKGGIGLPDKTLYAPFARYFNNLGYALVSADYRLTPRYTYPSQIEDVFCALAWVHANHETYNLDNENIVILGDSAGGYLAAMLGTIDAPEPYLEGCPFALPESNWFQGVMIFYGFYDFTNIDDYAPGEISFGLEPYWGATWSEIPSETLAEMSPVSWKDGSEPPFLLIHSPLDTGIPSWMSEKFAATLEDDGVEVEVLLVEADHGFILESLTNPINVEALNAMEDFITKVIKK